MCDDLVNGGVDLIRIENGLHIQVIKNLSRRIIKHLFSPSEKKFDQKIAEYARTILSPFDNGVLMPYQSLEYHYGSLYSNVNQITLLNDFPMIKDALFKQLKLSSEGTTRAVTKVQNLREASIVKILSVLGLSDYIIPTMKYQLPRMSSSDKRKSVLLMPKMLLEPIPRQRAKGIKGVFQLKKINPTIVDGLLSVGLIHALLRVQEGGWGNVGVIQGTGGTEQVRCNELRKSLVPFRLIKSRRRPPTEKEELSSSNSWEKSSIIALQSFIWTTPYMDYPLPDALVKLLSSEDFISVISGQLLNTYLDPTDPLRCDKKILIKAEKDFKQRCTKLHKLASSSKTNPLTLNRVFRDLYPEKMYFVHTAQKLGVPIYPTLCVEDVLKEAWKRLSREQILELEDALRILKYGEISGDLYGKLY